MDVVQESTEPKPGQQPSWNQQFSFGYKKLSKACLKMLARKKPPQVREIPQND